jgi:hypothetical protein
LFLALLSAQMLPAETAKLTAGERTQGWRLLFDGATTRDWHGYGQNKAPADWQAREGELWAGGREALVHDSPWVDFELVFEWRAEEGGAAAAHFRIGGEDAPLSLGGVIFELAGGDAEPGGNGGLHRATGGGAPAAGHWHTARLVVYGHRVEYWINGAQVNGYTIDGREWRAALANSRFQVVPDYGLNRSGLVALSGDKARFRNIKARPL